MFHLVEAFCHLHHLLIVVEVGSTVLEHVGQAEAEFYFRIKLEEGEVKVASQSAGKEYVGCIEH